MADANMDIDMDIDLVLDTDADPEIARLQAEAAAFDAQPTGGVETEVMKGVEEAPEEGEVDANAPVAKVHLRGVNSLTTTDIRNYADEHYPTELFKHVQWVDDTSANLVYDTDMAAAEALHVFSAEDEVDPLKVRLAKGLSTHPETQLFVRQAMASDVKVKDARVRSRFYLDNPQYDPENNKRRADDDGSYNRNYRSRDYGHKRVRRDVGDDMYVRRGSTQEPFHVDMYDDDKAAREARKKRRESHDSGSAYGKKNLRFERDLTAPRENGRLRSRSASPGRDGDGRFGFADNQPTRRTARPRSPTPPRVRAERDRSNRTTRDSLRKELFPEKKLSASPAPNHDRANGHTNGTAVELFPNHLSSSSAPRELFPNHKRNDAKDLGRPDAKDLDREYKVVESAIGNYHLDGVDESQQTYRRPDRRPGSRGQRDGGKPRDLFSRIDGGKPKVGSEYGRLRDRPTSSRSAADDAGFSFKGAGGSSSGGFSILGASRERVENPLVKELFPMKAGGGSSGNDLFDGKIKGRGSQRRRAEDLF